MEGTVVQHDDII